MEPGTKWECVEGAGSCLILTNRTYDDNALSHRIVYFPDTLEASFNGVSSVNEE